MKTFDLTSMGVQEMSALEMQETDGGVLWIVVAAALILLGSSSCQTQITIQVSGQDSEINSATQSADSTLNGNDGRLAVDR